MKQPNKAKLVVAFKRCRSVGLFDEVRVVQIRVKRPAKAARNK
jgi:hypothetical protein